MCNNENISLGLEVEDQILTFSGDLEPSTYSQLKV